MCNTQVYDYLIIGAGIAGTSLAYRLQGRGSALLIDGESQAGYHSTGRSAAMFMETYGTPTIQALTRASRQFYEHPPQGFCDHPLLRDRGVLYIAHQRQEQLFQDAIAQYKATGAHVNILSADEVVKRVPCIKRQGLLGAIEEADAKDLDVHAVLQGFMKGAKQSGVKTLFNATVVKAHRAQDTWSVELSQGSTIVSRKVVNAAGAWGDRVAALFGADAVGLQPKRRSAFTFQAPDKAAAPGMEIEHWPAVVGIDESFYFKPDAGQLLGSPANADPVEPHDVVAEEFDIALGIDRIETATDLAIRRPSHTWAGLRSFVDDGEFVMGWDKRAQGFFWLIGQGGYGIQTSPGASLLASNLLLNEELDASLQAEKIDPAIVSPSRFARHGRPA